MPSRAPLARTAPRTWSVISTISFRSRVVTGKVCMNLPRSRHSGESTSYYNTGGSGDSPMNRRQFFGLFSFFVIVNSAPAQEEAKAVIERAIGAHGGAEKLDKYLAGRVQSKGSIAAQGGQVPFVSTVVYQLPDKVKNTVEFALQGGARPVTQIMNGEKVGVVINGIAQQVLPAQADEMKQAAHA